MSTTATPARLLRQAFALAAASGLLLGPALAAHAQTDTKDPKTAPTTDKGEKRSAPLLGDESFDPNQPIKTNFILSVSVAGEPDPSGNYPVDEAGNIGIKYQGIMTPVKVRGLTPDMAADAIAKVLKLYVKNPDVKVIIASVPHPIVFVSGAVRTQGNAIIDATTSLVDLLSRAEYSDNADLTQVRIRRSKPAAGEPSLQIVNFEKYVRVKTGETPDEQYNPILRDGDRVYVPAKQAPGTTGTIAVIGEVSKPQQGLALRTGVPLTVREAINLAGGITPSANSHTVSIRRVGIERPIIIDLEKAETGDIVNNIELKPDDAIYVEKLENNAYINVNGGFVKTGKYIYDKRMTLTQIIEDAGGVAPYAKEKDGRIFRHPTNDAKDTRIIAFNWHDIQNGKAPDIALQPNDSVMLTPGGPSRAITFFDALNGLTSAVYLYNNLSGRYYGNTGR